MLHRLCLLRPRYLCHHLRWALRVALGQGQAQLQPVQQLARSRRQQWLVLRLGRAR